MNFKDWFHKVEEAATDTAQVAGFSRRLGEKTKAFAPARMFPPVVVMPDPNGKKHERKENS